MKKVFLFFIILTLFLIFPSCTTTQDTVTITQEEAQDAFSLLLQQANIQAMSYVFSQSSQLDLMSDNLYFIKEYENQIPNMERLLNLWNEEIAISIQDLIQMEKSSLDVLVQAQTFPNALQMINESLTNTSELFRKCCEEKIKNTIKENLKDMIDYTLESEILELFDSFMKIESLLGNMEYRKINKLIEIDNVANIISDAYFNALSESEKNIRTTPDLYQDSLLIKVFSLI